MTSAKRIGVNIGTAIWRGLRAVSETLRPASARNARPERVRGRAVPSGARTAG
jgi:hypothetical protein